MVDGGFGLRDWCGKATSGGSWGRIEKPGRVKVLQGAEAQRRASEGVVNC